MATLVTVFGSEPIFSGRPENAQVPRAYEISHSGDVFRFIHREVPFRLESFQVDLNVPSVWKNNGRSAPRENLQVEPEKFQVDLKTPRCSKCIK